MTILSQITSRLEKACSAVKECAVGLFRICKENVKSITDFILYWALVMLLTSVPVLYGYNASWMLVSFPIAAWMSVALFVWLRDGPIRDFIDDVREDWKGALCGIAVWSGVGLFSALPVILGYNIFWVPVAFGAGVLIVGFVIVLLINLTDGWH